MSTHFYVVPATFWEDHVDRACRCGDRPVCPLRDKHQADGYGERTSKGYRVELTDTDRRELLSDAEHYSDYTHWGNPQGIGLQSSARATVNRLNKETN